MWRRVRISPLLVTWVRAHIIACLECEDWSTTTITLFFTTNSNTPLSSPLPCISIFICFKQPPHPPPTPHLLDVDFHPSLLLSCLRNESELGILFFLYFHHLNTGFCLAQCHNNGSTLVSIYMCDLSWGKGQIKTGSIRCKKWWGDVNQMWFSDKSIIYLFLVG